jgi:hypothetical protein
MLQEKTAWGKAGDVLLFFGQSDCFQSSTRSGLSVQICVVSPLRDVAIVTLIHTFENVILQVVSKYTPTGFNHVIQGKTFNPSGLQIVPKKGNRLLHLAFNCDDNKKKDEELNITFWRRA